MIAGDCRRPARALTVMAGDWNFVTASKDRCCCATGDWSGDRDAAIQQLFMDSLTSHFELHDWHQSFFTHQSALSRGRLDRVYCSSHIADQQDKHCSATAMGWVPGLSAHRPLSFARESKPLDSAPNSLPGYVFRAPGYADMVHTIYEDSLRREVPEDAIRRLELFKRALVHAGHSMSKALRDSLVTPAEDRLGLTMSFLRAAEELRLGRMD